MMDDSLHTRLQSIKVSVVVVDFDLGGIGDGKGNGLANSPADCNSVLLGIYADNLIIIAL